MVCLNSPMLLPSQYPMPTKDIVCGIESPGHSELAERVTSSIAASGLDNAEGKVVSNIAACGLDVAEEKVVSSIAAFGPDNAKGVESPGHAEQQSDAGQPKPLREPLRNLA